MSKYRARPENFLPPPKKSSIQHSKLKFVDANENPWLFHRDWPISDRPKRYKEWPIFFVEDPPLGFTQGTSVSFCNKIVVMKLK